MSEPTRIVLFRPLRQLTNSDEWVIARRDNLHFTSLGARIPVSRLSWMLNWHNMFIYRLVKSLTIGTLKKDITLKRFNTFHQDFVRKQILAQMRLRRHSLALGMGLT